MRDEIVVERLPQQIQPCDNMVRIRLGTTVLAASTEAKYLIRSAHPPRLFLPLKDVFLTYFKRTDDTHHVAGIGCCGVWNLKLARKKLLKSAMLTVIEPPEPAALLMFHATFDREHLEVELPSG